MNPTSNIQNQKSSRPGPAWNPEPLNPLPPRRLPAAFSLVELLVVITIIGMLAGISIPAVGGAMKSARRAEVTTVAQSIRTAIMAWNSEYGTWPTNVSPFDTDRGFLDLMTTTNQQTATANPRGIIFLEIPAKFTNSSGIVTPAGYLANRRQQNFSGAIDLTGSGQLRFTAGGSNVTIRSAVAIWAPDNKDETKAVGTWK